MDQSLTVSTCVVIRTGCPIRCHISRDNSTEFSFGGPRDGFDFVFEVEPLRELVKLGAEVLSQLDRAQSDPTDPDDVRGSVASEQ